MSDSDLLQQRSVLGVAHFDNYFIADAGKGF